MKKTLYTFMVIPQKKGAVRKINLSLSSIGSLIFAIMLILAVSVYLCVDKMENEKKLGDLEHYRQITETQKEQIDLLADKVTEFEKKMENLQQIDRKLRSLSNLRSDRDVKNFMGVGGSIPDGMKAGESEKRAVKEIDRSMDELLEKAESREKSLQELIGFFIKQQSVRVATPSIWPVAGWVTSEFGYRISPFSDRKELHQGLDIATRPGEEVVAPANGVVRKVGYEPGMGQVVVINHGYGFVTSYAHLKKNPPVKTGRKVRRGDVIGYVGMSGKTTGPHLHYSVSVNGRYMNPRKYLM
ncbi:MAG: peptidoglycan DD-metalloendopeptidase family protein [Deltaproteobacteria bacterium]|nr:peptidoglycan DD-metalloendopeptidase family protein [Deltaproteobacteria bacterium]